MSPLRAAEPLAGPALAAVADVDFVVSSVMADVEPPFAVALRPVVRAEAPSGRLLGSSCVCYRMSWGGRCDWMCSPQAEGPCVTCVRRGRARNTLVAAVVGIAAWVGAMVSGKRWPAWAHGCWGLCSARGMAGRIAIMSHQSRRDGICV